VIFKRDLTPLNAEINPTCHLLALLGAHHILHVSRIRVNYTNSITKVLFPSLLISVEEAGKNQLQPGQESMGMHQFCHTVLC
jgi:hypothetical protein